MFPIDRNCSNVWPRAETPKVYKKSTLLTSRIGLIGTSAHLFDAFRTNFLVRVDETRAKGTVMMREFVSGAKNFRIPVFLQVISITILLLTLTLPAGATVIEFAGGDGTPENPWQINTPTQLDAVRNYLGVAGTRHFVLTSDLDLAVAPFNQGSSWEPIGTQENPFNSIIDGDGHTVSGLFIDRPETNFVGLFGYTDLATIKNIHLKNVSIVGNQSVGSLVGESYRTTVNNSSATGTVAGGINTSMVGGLVGFNRWQSSITNSFANVTVQGNSVVGGLTGESEGSITASYAIGNVTGGAENVGGLVGLAYGQIQDSYATGAVSGIKDVGGLVGDAAFGMCTINNSYATGLVTGTGDNIGGLVGLRNGGVITSSYYDRDTTEQTDTGKGEPRTSGEMKNELTFIDWNFPAVWKILSGDIYPYLSWQPAAAEFSGGNGSQDNPWQIRTAAQLSNLRNYRGADHADKHFMQVANIDLGVSPWNQNTGWDPIGGYLDNISFRGEYDGNGYRISNLTINTTVTETYPSLFGRVGYTAKLKNIKLEDLSIAGMSHIGALVGELEGGTILNSSATGTITLKSGSYPWYSGGLVGSFSSGLIENCHAAVSITANPAAEKIGGLVGYIQHATLRNSYATGNVTGQEAIGGLIGRIVNNVTVENTYATGAVSGILYTGGLVGNIQIPETTAITNSFYDQNTTGQTDNGKGAAKTTSELMQKNTFINWNFNSVWKIGENSTYPYLSWPTVAPALLSPADMTMVNGANPLLTWLPLTNPDSRQIIRYHLQFGTSPDLSGGDTESNYIWMIAPLTSGMGLAGFFFAGSLLHRNHRRSFEILGMSVVLAGILLAGCSDNDSPQQESTVISHTLQTLEPDTTYYWRVKAQDDLGQWSDWSEIRSFSTPVFPE